MASGFHLVFLLCLTSGLLIAKSASVTGDADQEAYDCSPGWTKFGSRCYIFYHLQKSWIDAEDICLSAGGNLVSVHNDDENAFLRDLIERSTGRYLPAWIGGTDAIMEGRWLWSDGTRFDYTHWGLNEPNNAGIENCLEMNWEGNFWNDKKCTEPRPFICAMNI